MNWRAISTLLMLSWLGFGVPAGAQDGGVEETAPETEEKPEPPPTAGALPYEDPTIQPEKKEDVKQLGAAQDAGPEDEAAASEEAAGEDETGEVDVTRTTGSLPVEDPTLHAPTETEPSEEPGPEDGKPADAPAAEPYEGSNVKVFYGYQTGLLVGVDDWFYLSVAGLVQARYTVNYRTKPPTDPTTLEREKQVSQGFDMARARFQLGIGLTQFVALYMRIGVVAGGDFSFQRAFIDLKWKYLRLRAGLFMNETIAESLINPNDLYFLDYSIVENVYTPGSSKGVMFTYLRRRFSINLGYSDGLRTGFSEIRSATRADFAVTLRTQYAWGERGLSGFNRLTARRGTPFGIRLGAAVHYQDGGRSQGTAPVKIALGTVDVSARGNGWSALLSITAGQDGTAATATTPAGEIVSTGASLMGGYFVMDDLQVFAQYSIVAKPKIEGEPPPGIPGADLADLSNFQSFGIGLSYFVIPGYDNVKLSTDFQYFLGHTLGSSVPASPLNSIAPNNDGSQFAWRIQLSAAF
jgi:hypothetical protein